MHFKQRKNASFDIAELMLGFLCLKKIAVVVGSKNKF
jgi:hypothetical protein